MANLPADLVSRLRVHANRDNCISHDWGGEHHDAGEDCQQAADAIDRLNERIAKMEERRRIALDGLCPETSRE